MVGGNTAEKIERCPSRLGYDAVILPIRDLMAKNQIDYATDRIIAGLKDRKSQFTEFYVQMAGELGAATEEVIDLIWSADDPEDVFITSAATIALAKLIPYDQRVCRRIVAGLQSSDFFVIASCCDAAVMITKDVLKKNRKIRIALEKADEFIENLNT